MLTRLCHAQDIGQGFLLSSDDVDHDLARTFSTGRHFCFDPGCMELAASMSAPRAKMGIGSNPRWGNSWTRQEIAKMVYQKARQGFALSRTSLR
jgi:hypothetical protein